MSKSIFADMREDQFCVGALARNEEGLAVSPLSTEAKAWDAYGWIRRCTETGLEDLSYCDQAHAKAKAIAEKLGYRNAVHASDKCGWAFIEKLKEAGV